MKKDEERLPIARIGKSVGLRGEMRLNLLSDFPEQFKKGATFDSDRGPLTVASYNEARSTVRFEGIDDVESAKRLTNTFLYTTKAAGEAACRLEKDEYFWYQIIGLLVYDEGESVPLGRVNDIERMAGTDYLLVRTSPGEEERGAPESFLIPYIDRYVDRVELPEGKIITHGARDLMNAS